MGQWLRWAVWGTLLVAVAAFVASCSATTGSSAGTTSTPDSKNPATGAANGPRIVVSEDSFDFGKVPLNKVVSHAFKIKNVGTAPLAFLGTPPVRAVQGC